MASAPGCWRRWAAEVTRLFALAGALCGLFGLAAAAAGAHGPYASATLTQTGHLQILHGLALLAVAARPPGPAARLAGALFILGILLFCGAIYAPAFLGLRLPPMSAPAGGLALLAGWASLAVAVWRR